MEVILKLRLELILDEIPCTDINHNFVHLKGTRHYFFSRDKYSELSVKNLFLEKFNYIGFSRAQLQLVFFSLCGGAF